MKYRMAVEATVIFTVWADSEEQARELAEDAKRAHFDGMDLEPMGTDKEAVVYMRESSTPEVEDAYATDEPGDVHDD